MMNLMDKDLERVRAYIRSGETDPDVKSIIFNQKIKEFFYLVVNLFWTYALLTLFVTLHSKPEYWNGLFDVLSIGIIIGFISLIRFRILRIKKIYFKPQDYFREILKDKALEEKQIL